MRKVHRSCPSGVGLQYKAIKCASSSPVIFRRWALVTGLRYKAASKPSATKRFLSCSTFFVDTSYAEAMSSFVHPQDLVWSKNSCGLIRVVFHEPPEPFSTVK